MSLEIPSLDTDSEKQMLMNSRSKDLVEKTVSCCWAGCYDDFMGLFGSFFLSCVVSNEEIDTTLSLAAILPQSRDYAETAMGNLPARLAISLIFSGLPIQAASNRS